MINGNKKEFENVEGVTVMKNIRLYTSDTHYPASNVILSKMDFHEIKNPT